MRTQTVFVSATPGPWELGQTKGKYVDQIIRPTGLIDPPVEIRPAKNQVDDLMYECKKVIENNQAQISEYKQATHEKKTKMIGFFIGQIMKESRGKVNPREANRVLTEALRRI